MRAHSALVHNTERKRPLHIRWTWAGPDAEPKTSHSLATASERCSSGRSAFLFYATQSPIRITDVKSRSAAGRNASADSTPAYGQTRRPAENPIVLLRVNGPCLSTENQAASANPRCVSAKYSAAQSSSRSAISAPHTMPRFGSLRM